MAEFAGDVERREDLEQGPGGTARYYQQLIDLATDRESEWREQARKTIVAYEDSEPHSDHRFNILYANTELAKPAVYATMPTPVVQRRFKDRNPVYRQVAEVLERCLEYNQEMHGLDEAVKNARDDYLLAGRGVVRVSLETDLSREKLTEAIEGAGVFVDANMNIREPDGTDANGPYFEELTDQIVSYDYVYWEDFRILGDARVWKDVQAIAFRHLFTRDELEEQFGSDGSKVPLSHVMQGLDADEVHAEVFRRAVIWEIWDKDTRERVWIGDGHPTVLEREDDPLELEGFFPVAQPLYAIKNTNHLVPRPEYTIYQDQADELDAVTRRINKLVESVKAVGFYPGEHKADFQKLADAKDGDLVPVENFIEWSGKGGAQAISWVPIQSVAATIVALYEQRERLKQVIFEMTGIADLMRGAGDPRETATAARIKGEFGSLRVRDKQADVQHFIRDLYRISAEITAEHMEPQMLQMKTGIPVTPEMLQIMRNDKLRGYAVNVETDSTLAIDEQADKAQIMEMAEVVTAGLTKLAEAQAAAPMMVPVVGELLLTTIRGFRRARGLEDSLEDMVDQLTQQQQMQQQQPQAPDPAQMKMQAEMQAKQIEVEAKAAERAQEMEFKQADRQEQLAFERAKHDQALAFEREKFQQGQMADVERTLRNEDREDRRMVLEARKMGLDERNIGPVREPTDAEIAIAQISTALPQMVDSLAQNQAQMMQGINELSSVLSAPKKLVRDKKGKAVGVETVVNGEPVNEQRVVRDERGRAEALVPAE